MSRRDAYVFYVKITPKGQAAQRLDQSARLLSLTYEDDEAKADKLTVTVDNHDFSFFDNPIFQKGNEIEAAWGYQGELCPPRTCVIQGAKGARVLTVEALAKSMLLNQKPVSEAYGGRSYAQIAREIAERNGYTGSFVDIEETDLIYPYVAQAKLTDAAFLKSLAAREHFVFYVDHTGFHFHRRRVGAQPKRKFTFYTASNNDGAILGDIAVESDVIAKPGAVTMAGIDPLTKKEIKVTATNESVPNRDVLAPVVEVPGPFKKVEGDTGVISVTDQAQAPAASQAILTTTAATPAAATRLANAAFQAVQQTAVKLGFQIIGDPAVSAKMVIELAGVGKRLSGRYYVSAAKHVITPASFIIDLKCRSDGGNSAGAGAGAAGASTTAAGKANTQSAPDVPDPTLQPKKVVSDSTGETTTVYVSQ